MHLIVKWVSYVSCFYVFGQVFLLFVKLFQIIWVVLLEVKDNFAGVSSPTLNPAKNASITGHTQKTTYLVIRTAVRMVNCQTDAAARRSTANSAAAVLFSKLSRIILIGHRATVD